MSAPAPAPDVLFWRLTTLLCGAGFLALAAFVAAPGIDLWAAGLFFDGAGFPLRDDPWLGALRFLYRLVFVACCAAVILTLLARLTATLAPSLAPPTGWAAPLRLWLFFAALLAVGPGLIANALFKERWGRARPEAVEAFGGPHPLTPPFGLSDACAGNCSFVSGEGAAAAALAFGLLVAFWTDLRTPRARGVALGMTALWLAGAALIRMAPGKHFLSDTLFAYVLMGLTTAALYRLLALRGARAGVGAMAADAVSSAHTALGAGAALARRIARGKRAETQDTTQGQHLAGR
jgi:lipid A 4'-phosphatase